MKQCRHPTCGDICRREKKKKIYKPLKRTKPIRKVSKKQQKLLGEKKLQTTKDRLFFLEIWNERPHICFESNVYLGEQPLTLFFHHVLPKKPKNSGGYPEYRYNKWNIVLLSWEEHDKAERNIDLVPKVKAYRNFLIKKFKL